MSRQVVNEEEVDIDIQGETCLVTFTRTTNLSYDSNYGADADGERGIGAWFVDDDVESNVIVDKKPLKDYPLDFQEDALEAIHAWMKDHDADNK